MRQARRAVGWAGLAVLMLAAITVTYWLLGRLAEEGPEAAGSALLLTLLSIALVVLFLALAGVLIRNVVRLVMDRRRGILGSRLRSKLFFFFLVLVLPPSLVLFYGSAAIIKQTVEAMLRTPVESITQDAQFLVDLWLDSLQEEARREAGAMATTLGGSESPEDLEAIRLGTGADLVAVLDGRGEVRAVAVSPVLRALPEAIPESLAAPGAEGPIRHVGGGLLVTSRAPRGGSGGEVLVAYFVPADVTARLQAMTEAATAFRRFRVQRRELVRLYLTLIGLIFIVSIFVATWMAFYLSRRISDPVRDLAAAAREISAGNLSVRVQRTAGDEIGTLVEAFNDMAAQLQESQEVITRSTAELRRSNRALDERRRYIETLLANLSTGVISVDRGGRVSTANPAADLILGFEVRVGEPVLEQLQRPGLEDLHHWVEQAWEAAEPSPRKDVSLRREGEALHVAVQVTPLRGADGERLGSLIMLEDLTDLARAQRAMAWREMAQQLAHEIKNPLTPIQLAAQRLRKRFQEGADDLPQVVDEATRAVEREVAALKSLVDEFSRFARMPEIRKQWVEVGEVVDRAVELFRGIPGLEWTVAVDPGLGPVAVDPEQLRRALVNLLDNAIAAMNRQGRIEVRVTGVPGSGMVRLEVADDGPGIPPETRAKMFVPYFSTKKRGTGLGLAIVHRIVTDHQGTIRVENNRPRGTRVVIEIPVGAAA